MSNRDDIETVRLIVRDELLRGNNNQVEQNKSTDSVHDYHKQLLNDVGANWMDCKDCGLQTVNDRPFGEDDWHECTGDNCDANRVKNGAKTCAWCGQNQNGEGQ